MKIGVLTSSRADYGIYLPLLNQMKADGFFDLEIIAFGTHLSNTHGYTVNSIKSDGFKKIHEIDSLEHDDSTLGIARSYGKTVINFANFWNENTYDLVFCLGDRFEMSAAVQASIPFGVKLAHLHGGETTLGAIDNIYRHQITLASQLHFVATEAFKAKVENLIDDSKQVYNVGALSLDGIEKFIPRIKNELLEEFQIPNNAFVLVTFHPETIAIESNKRYALEMRKALSTISKNLNVVITMPNADTLGSVYRKEIHNLKSENSDQVFLVENFGKHNYFSAMSYAEFLIGNTSSGIIEAASFKKYVINVGDRQKGRARGTNVYDVPFSYEKIIEASKTVSEQSTYNEGNIYHKPRTAETIIKILKAL